MIRKKVNRKPGPKPKINEKAKAEIFACLTVGASLADAADYIGVSRDTLNRKLREDQCFRKGVDRAVANGKIRHIKKVGKARPWQASAWMLERKWGSEFGKHVEVTGKDGGPIEIKDKRELSTYAIDEALERYIGGRVSRGASHNGNGESLHTGAER